MESKRRSSILLAVIASTVLTGLNPPNPTDAEDEQAVADH